MENTSNSPYQIDMTSTALAYGLGATDRSIHHQLCKCRQLADQLRDEVERSGLSKPPRGSEVNAATLPRTPRASRVQSSGVGKSGGGSSRARSSAASKAAKKKKNVDATPTKAGKGTFTTTGLSMIDAIAVDSHDEDESIISLTKSETVSLADDIKKEEAKDAFKREVDLMTPEPQLVDIEKFGRRAMTPRAESQTNGYALGFGVQSTAINADEFSINEIFDAIIN